MSIIIHGMDMPKKAELWIRVQPDGKIVSQTGYVIEDASAEQIPPHGRLIDADALRAKMYHEAFETDSPMQKWDSGCWIRYKMFERMEEAASTIIEAEEG